MQPSAELLGVAEDYFASGPAGAQAWRARFVEPTDHLRIIGTDEDEWLVGEAAFAALADESAHLEAEVHVVLRDGEAFESGGVGWVAGRPEVTLPDGTTFTMRWTGVFEKSAEVWLLRQMHVSRA